MTLTSSWGWAFSWVSCDKQPREEAGEQSGVLAMHTSPNDGHGGRFIQHLVHADLLVEITGKPRPPAEIGTANKHVGENI